MTTNGGKISVMLGLLVLGLSPSFIDWQQSPDKRVQIYGYYAVAFLLIGLGLWDGE
jgi:hypothetical protein